MPLFIRKFIVDFLETGIAAIFALSVAFPTDIATAMQVAVVFGLALLGAAVSSARRAAPTFIEWIRERMNVPAS